MPRAKPRPPVDALAERLDAAVRALDALADRRTRLAVVRAEAFDLRADIDRYARRVQEVDDALRGLSDPRYASESARLTHDRNQARAALDSAQSRLSAVEREMGEDLAAADPEPVDRDVLRAHRARMLAAEARVATLTSHRERLAADPEEAQPTEAALELEDLLARRALGEDVGSTLDEVGLLVERQAHADAQCQAERVGALAGVSRKLEAAEGDLDLLREQGLRLASGYWARHVEPAAVAYEDAAGRTADALAHLIVVSELAGQEQPLGLDLGGLRMATLPAIRRGASGPILEFYGEAQAARVEEMRETLVGVAHE